LHVTSRGYLAYRYVPEWCCYNTAVKKRKYNLRIMPTKDKEKRNATNRASYHRNKEKRQKKNRENKATAKEKWKAFKSTLSCVQCGQNHPAVLDFHHIERHPSNRKVNKLLTNKAYKKAAEEVKKCIVLCSNCHRIHHHNERLEKKKGAEAPSDHSTSTQSSASSSK
jgi:hypothetical protein